MTETAAEGWQSPPEPIASMLATPRLPAVSFSPDAQWIVELSYSGLPPIQELTLPKVAIAGIQLNPHTWGLAKPSYYNHITLRHRQDSTARPVTLPADARIRNLIWSKDSRYLCFTHTYLGVAPAHAPDQDPDQTSDYSPPGKSQAAGISLWVLELATAQARPLTGPILNGTQGTVVRWLPDNRLLCKVRVDNGPPPQRPVVPPAPVIEENLGRTTPARTYTNLLQNPYDEALLEYYLSAQLVLVDLSGQQQAVTAPDLLRSFMPSPDGKWIMVTTTHRPFSYQVPLARFPRRVAILNLAGQPVYTVAELPLAEEIPIDFDSVRRGRRAVGWRADQPATLYWVEALDGGDARQESPYRDGVYFLRAPFTEDPQLLWQSSLRFNTLLWGNGTTALAYESWYNSRQLRTWHLAPDQPDKPAVLLEERNFQDAYSHPGEPVMTPGDYGWPTLLLSPQGDLYLNGRGASPTGVQPFLDRFNLTTHTKQRLWISPADSFCRVSRVLDAEAKRFIVRRSTKTAPGNYWLHHSEPASNGPAVALTNFQDPLPWYQKVTKEIVRYRRADGVDLSATLYLPPDHDLEREGPLPTLLWVYPEEHKSRETASQVTRAENTFSRPHRASPLFLLTQGYALLSGPTMPIVGEGESEPNDTYLEQLVASAAAAVAYLLDRGVCDRDRIAIGGHSYGAFTTANLLAHSDLFAAGIARSGAYNRTLTPFGFQGEQRNFWQAPETYIQMSPFTCADKITRPLLLIHGAADNNSGTYPLQSERLYEAIKGLGGIARFVSLPYEEHGYRSQEAVGHVLWEMVRWLDRYLKDTSPTGEK